jgi:hypothetical protein
MGKIIRYSGTFCLILVYKKGVEKVTLIVTLSVMYQVSKLKVDGFKSYPP